MANPEGFVKLQQRKNSTIFYVGIGSDTDHTDWLVKSQSVKLGQLFGSEKLHVAGHSRLLCSNISKSSA